ncbi:DMT family transporter [Pedobacter sp. MR2016-24]|uniref:DMT family transporter n=1 Tax=Pedobacter sp. MR2016-24 TaxID=2994466 RepID=UPI0022482929|nr:DMT family transporter [Pedobacter sp. MR2016-24]MCX2486384.1 DMT family transporter [Pedobacter sp. MR2016-24]
MKRAFTFLHISILLAGFTGVFGRLITMNAGLISWYRLLFSGLFLLVFLRFSGKLKRYDVSAVLKISLVGFILAVNWVFFYESIKYSNISIGVVCYSLTGFFTAIIAPLINRKKIQFAEILLSSLTLCGIALIFGLDATYRTGIIFGIISSVIGTFYTIYNERLTKTFNSETITLYTMLGGCAGLTLIMPAYLFLSPAETLLPSREALVYLLLLSLFCTVLMYLLLTKALHKISAFTVNLSFNLEPLYSILLAIVIYKENKELSAPFYCGLVLIMLSVVLQMWRVARYDHSAHVKE